MNPDQRPPALPEPATAGVRPSAGRKTFRACSTRLAQRHGGSLSERLPVAASGADSDAASALPKRPRDRPKLILRYAVHLSQAGRRRLAAGNRRFGRRILPSSRAGYLNGAAVAPLSGPVPILGCSGSPAGSCVLRCAGPPLPSPSTTTAGRYRGSRGSSNAADLDFQLRGRKVTSTLRGPACARRKRRS